MTDVFNPFADLLAVMITQDRAEEATRIRQINDDDIVRIRHLITEQNSLDAGAHFTFYLTINHWACAGLQPPQETVFLLDQNAARD